ncbi:uncharacterized protein [Triticum aestivum]|uniref:uncharacterized protein isoform X1 n=1 Tax=Triticum aestivum TaxID=4565 RepID=UPI001D03188A|nr:uncharacterized protein LOC123134256 isoform X1 [Triticum aestivum]
MAKRRLLGSSSVGRPGHVLLCTRGWHASKLDVVRCITARTTTEAMGSMKVTIFIKDLPSLSYFHVSCPDLQEDHFTQSPEILWSSEYCILFRMFPRSGRPQLFICRDEQPGCKPSLDPLPQVDSHLASESISPYLVGVVPDFDSQNYVLAAFRMDCVSRIYTLHVFRSKGSIWSKHILAIDLPSWIYSIRPGLFPDKVIALGEEVGYVDLWKGILLCNVLEEQVTARFVPLPDPLPNNLEYYDEFSSIEIRDVTCTESPDGFIIRCVEMEDLFSSTTTIPEANVIFDSDVDPTKKVVEPECVGWRLVTWYRETSWNYWSKEHIVNVDDLGADWLLPSNPSCVQSSFPILCGDDAVCLLSMSDDSDGDGWIVTIDIERKKVRGIIESSCDRYMLFSSAISCAPKKYPDGGPRLLSKTSSVDADGNKRPKYVFQLPDK